MTARGRRARQTPTGPEVGSKGRAARTRKLQEQHEKELPSKLRLLGDFGRRLTDRNLKQTTRGLTTVVTAGELKKLSTAQKTRALKKALKDAGFDWHSDFARSKHTDTPEKLIKYLEHHGVVSVEGVKSHFIGKNAFGKKYGLSNMTIRTLIRAIESQKIKLARLQLTTKTALYVEEELEVICRQPFIHRTLLHFAVSPHAKRYWEQRLKDPPFK
jgi:hypothetical protein